MQADSTGPLPISFISSRFLHYLLLGAQHHYYFSPQKYPINSQNSTDPSEPIIPFPIAPSPNSPNAVESHYLNLPTPNGTSTALTPQTPAPAVTIQHLHLVAPALSSPDSRFPPPSSPPNRRTSSLPLPSPTPPISQLCSNPLSPPSSPSLSPECRLCDDRLTSRGPIRVQVIPPTDTAKRC